MNTHNSKKKFLAWLAESADDMPMASDEEHREAIGKMVDQVQAAKDVVTDLNGRAPELEEFEELFSEVLKVLKDLAKEKGGLIDKNEPPAAILHESARSKITEKDMKELFKINGLLRGLEHQGEGTPYLDGPAISEAVKPMRKILGKFIARASR